MLNERIKMLRQCRKMSQVELAKRLSVTKQCVSNWENDNIQPSVDMLVRIAEAFGVTTDFLLGLSEKRSLDITGLSDTEIAHVQMIIEDIVKKRS